MVYVRLADNSTRGVPAWMFDPVVCAGVRASEEPVIECEALLDLASLVDTELEGRATVGDEPTTRIPHNAGGRTERPTDAASEPSGEGPYPGAASK